MDGLANDLTVSTGDDTNETADGGEPNAITVGSDNSSTNNDFFLVSEACEGDMDGLANDLTVSTGDDTNETADGGEPNAITVGSDNSSTNNDFFLVSEGDLPSGSSGGSTSRGGGAPCNDSTEAVSRSFIEKELRDAACESEDTKSIQSANQDSRSLVGSGMSGGGSQQAMGSEKRREVDLVGLLVGAPEMVSQVDSTYLHGVTYLGCGTVDVTQGYKGALEVMLDLKREAMSAVPVTLVVPTNSAGHLRLITPGTDEVKFAVPVRNIACCTRGTTQEMQDCLGFVVSQPSRRSASGEDDKLYPGASSVPTESYLCHVVQFAALETISAALTSFSRAFGMNSMPPGGLHAILGEEPLLLVQFSVAVKEGEASASSGGGSNSTNIGSANSAEIKFSQNVPRDKTCLKLRQSVLKKIEIAVKVVSEPQLPIERTCGFFVQFDETPSSVKNRNYELLDHLDSSLKQYDDGSREVTASGILDPDLPQFTLFNSLTGKTGLLYVRFALDVVFLGIETPVRFHLPVVCRVLGRGERFFYPNRRPLLINYIINLKAIPDTDSSYRVESLKCESETSSSTGIAGSIFRISSSTLSYEFPTDDDGDEGEGVQGRGNMNGAGDFSGDYFGGSEADSLNQVNEDDPNQSTEDLVLMSGYGSVSKDCSQEILEKWDQVLKEWTNTGTPVVSSPIDSPDSNLVFSFGSSMKGRPQPKKVRHLVRTVGVPEALRGEVWVRQVGTEDSEELCTKYREFLDQECTNEDQIKRDIHRTFPANDFFKDDQGPGQEALLKIAKAYAQYDQEIGYCQGFTYIAAVLLLHMPEEQAFCVFVRLMGLFKLRELYKQDFYELKLKWYQLDNLVKDHIPTLYYHFQSIGLKSHMFSSQWFLTLYTAKFPLYLVYRIYDIIFSEGLAFLLNIALALLREASDELCRKSFEECNTYIKANIPRKYREPPAAEELIRKALQMKINPKKLSLYAKEYHELVQREERLKDPMERLKLEQQESHSKIMALEAEAVNLANELVNAKMDSQRKLETVEEKVVHIQAMFEKTHHELAEMQEQKQNLEAQVEELKQLVTSKSNDTNQQRDIVAEYRKLCSRLEQERDTQTDLVAKLKETLSQCQSCKDSCNDLISSQESRSSHVANGSTNSAQSHSQNPDASQTSESDSLAMEQELALTKLRLVEEQSHNQQLEHEVAELKQMVSAMSASANQSASSAAQWLLKRTPNFLSRNSVPNSSTPNAHNSHHHDIT